MYIAGLYRKQSHRNFLWIFISQKRSHAWPHARDWQTPIFVRQWTRWMQDWSMQTSERACSRNESPCRARESAEVGERCSGFRQARNDELVKSPKPCHPRECGGPEVNKITGFPLSREWRLMEKSDFLRDHQEIVFPLFISQEQPEQYWRRWDEGPWSAWQNIISHWSPAKSKRHCNVAS